MSPFCTLGRLPTRAGTGNFCAMEVDDEDSIDGRVAEIKRLMAAAKAMQLRDPHGASLLLDCAQALYEALVREEEQAKQGNGSKLH